MNWPRDSSYRSSIHNLPSKRRLLGGTGMEVARDLSVQVVDAEPLPASEEPPEGIAEVAIEQGVDDGVQGRVYITDPEEGGYDDGRRWRALSAAHRHRQIPGEEGQPTEEERSHYDAEGLGRFVLALHLASVLATALGVKVRRGYGVQLGPAVSDATQSSVVGRGGDRGGRDDGDRCRHLDVTLLSPGSAIDLDVCEDHDDRRRPEGNRTRYDS